MKYLKTFENMSNIIRDFDKSTYSTEDKSIIAAYMITSESEESIEILNIKETERSGIFLDNAIGYDITIHRVTLNKPQVEVLEDVTGKEGFKYLKIP